MAINPNIPLSGRPIDTTQAVPQMQDTQMAQLQMIKQQYDNASAEEKASALEEAKDIYKIEGMVGNLDAIGKYVSDPKNLNTQAAMEMRDEFLADKSADKSQFMMGVKGRKNLLVALGVLADPSKEGFTLGEGEKRFDSTGKLIASGPAKVAGSGKPMSATAIKLQDTLIGDLRTAKNLEADLGAAVDGLDKKLVNLGPVNNIGYKIENSGYVDSSPQSRNSANLMAGLQRMRNDSLRLNKGTQTEMDAERAWAELLGQDSKNPSLPKDNELLSSGLKRIAEYNARASEEKALRIDTIRNEYGHDPLDFSAIGNVKPSFVMEGQSNATPATTQVIPNGVDPRLWNAMTPEERKLFQ